MVKFRNAFALLASATGGAYFYFSLRSILYPAPFIDLTTNGQPVEKREVRPFSDALLHLVLFKW